MAIDTLDRKKSFIMIFSMCVGLWIGYALGSMPDIQVFKILNIIGILFDLLAVIILSPLVSKSEKVNRFIAIHVVNFIVIFLVSCPVGILLLSTVVGITSILALPSYKIVMTFSGAIALCLGLPIYAIYTVLESKPYKNSNIPQQRAKILGGFLLISGLVVQLVAAFMDFSS